MPKDVFTVRLDPELIAAFDQGAKALGVTRAALLTEVLTAFVQNRLTLVQPQEVVFVALHPTFPGE